MSDFPTDAPDHSRQERDSRKRSSVKDNDARSTESSAAEEHDAEAAAEKREQARRELEAQLARLPRDVPTLQRMVVDLSREAQANLDQLKRSLAEFANFRKRTAQAMNAFGAEGKIEFLQTLLPALDDLDQAVRTGIQSNKEDLRQGIAQLQQKVRKALEEAGFEIIDPMDQPFDPDIAEALLTTKVLDTEPDMVVETFTPAYRYKGRLIRPARVVVSS
jgi:molecular chaperone GrpE